MWLVKSYLDFLLSAPFNPKYTAVNTIENIKFHKKSNVLSKINILTIVTTKNIEIKYNNNVSNLSIKSKNLFEYNNGI
jgi:hypothetical protein